MKPRELAEENRRLIAEADRRSRILDACYGELIDNKRGIIRREYGWPDTLDLLTLHERTTTEHWK